jgi:hypothetical protein
MRKSEPTEPPHRLESGRLRHIRDAGEDADRGRVGEWFIDRRTRLR